MEKQQIVNEHFKGALMLLITGHSALEGDLEQALEIMDELRTGYLMQIKEEVE